MADNTTLDAGAGGDVIASDDIGGVKYPRVKVTFGADGSSTDVAAAAPLPVILASNSGVDVGDVTINNATLAVTQSGTWDVGTVTAVTTITNAVAVTNAGITTIAGAVAGTEMQVDVLTLPNVVLASGTVTAVTDITNAVKVIGPAAHDAVVSGAPVRLGAYAKAAAPTDVSADGDVVNLWADLAGRLAVWDGGLNLSIDDGGNTITVDGTVAVTNAGITTIAGAVSGTEMQVDVLTLPALPAGNNNIGDVDVATIAAGDNNIGNVDIVSLPASTNTLEVVGDAAHDAAVAGNPLLVGAYASATIPAAVSADGDAARLWVHRAGLLPVTLVDAAGDAVSVGGGTQYAVQSAFSATAASTVAGVVRKDVAADLAGADGDVTALQVDSAGALRVTGGGGGTEYVVNAVAPADPTGATFVMERDDALSALTEVEGDWTQPRASANGALWVAVDGSVAVTNAGLTELASAIDTEMQVDVVGALPAGDNNIGNVDLASAIPAGTNNIGDVDILTIAAGDNNIGNVDIVSLPATPAGTNAIGKLLPPDVDVTTHTNYAKKYYTSAGAATDGIIWSPAAGKRWHVVSMFINVSAAATVTLEDDLAGGDSPVLKMELAANSGFVTNFSEKYPLASGEDAADLIITTTAGNVYVTVTGYEI